MSKKIKRNQKRKQKTKPVLWFLLIAVAIIGVILTRYYFANYDSSLNENEIKKEQRSIPLDIKKEIPPSVSSKTSRVPILMYHYVEYVQDKGDTIRISLNIPPYILEQQIKTLLDAGYIFLTNSELADGIDGKIQLSEKTVLLTFDDGYRSFYSDVFPILKKYNVKATAYIVSGFINRPNNMVSSQIDEIVKSGLVEIGAHTVNHTWLKGKSLTDVTNEIAQSKVLLEDEFHTNVVSFAYPFGAFDAQSLQVIKSVGFKSAVSTIPGIEQSQKNRFFLFRLRPGGRTGQTLLTWLNQQTFSAF